MQFFWVHALIFPPWRRLDAAHLLVFILEIREDGIVLTLAPVQGATPDHLQWLRGDSDLLVCAPVTTVYRHRGDVPEQSPPYPRLKSGLSDLGILAPAGRCFCEALGQFRGLVRADLGLVARIFHDGCHRSGAVAIGGGEFNPPAPRVITSDGRIHVGVAVGLW